MGSPVVALAPDDLPATSTEGQSMVLTNNSFTTQPRSIQSLERRYGSTSDISMHADSEGDGEAVELATLDHGNITSPEGVTRANKRKAIDRITESDGNEGHTPRHNKKTRVGESNDGTARIPSDRSLLPSQIWHRIFTFVPPRSLGTLLQVNKLFNTYLDPSSLLNSQLPPTLLQSRASLLKPNAIWRASRRIFWPKMPAPLKEMSELNMWRLAGSKTCQFCGTKKSLNQLEMPDLWHSGPGVNGVATVFAFAVVSCGRCLLKKSVKEIDVLLSSSTPSSLIPALPYIFVTNELNAVSPSLLPTDKGSPEVQITKLYWESSIDNLKQELQSVREMGLATLEEWLKGLDDRGKEMRNDAFRWEKWQHAGGQIQTHMMLHHQAGGSSRLPSTCLKDEAKIRDQRVMDSAASPLESSRSSLPADTMAARLQTRCIETPSKHLANESAFGESQSAGVLTAVPRLQTSQGRHDRTREEVEELKALRRVEIERRAMLLDPPLPSNVLIHIPSFQAAIQIITPLDDNAWDLLNPRLLAQRVDAEIRERDSLAQSRVLLEHSNGKPSLNHIGRDIKEVMDKDWDEIQGPVRARIATYADETIRDGWDRGRKVNKESSPRFAAEVLIYVRKRFYAEVAKDAAAARTAGKEPVVDPPEGPFTQKLTLENMKWVFDTKVKPHTESYRKELFLCNGCENNTRYYGFEGVIQHYAAKHTNILSVGSVVVHWRAEWPEHPPFSPHPRAPKYQYYSGGDAAQYLQGATPQPPYSYSGYQHGAPPQQAQMPQPYAASSAAGYHTPYADTFGSQPPYQLPSTLPAAVAAPNLAYGPASSTPAYPPSLGGFLPYLPMPHDYGQGNIPVTEYRYDYTSYQGNGPIPYLPPQAVPVPYSDQYRPRLEDVARNSREAWNMISSIKDLPGSIKVSVVLHHVAKRFHARFSESPALAMFIDGLSNNKEMRPVRNVNDLLCKACTLGLGNALPESQGRKTFSLPQLINHFQSRHMDSAHGTDPNEGKLDWTRDMVLLPDPSSMPDLLTLLEPKTQKFNLIFEAVPWAFERRHILHPESRPVLWPPAAPQSQMPHSVDSHSRIDAQGYSLRQEDRTGPAQAHWPVSQHSVSVHDIVRTGAQNSSLASRAPFLEGLRDLPPSDEGNRTRVGQTNQRKYTDLPETRMKRGPSNMARPIPDLAQIKPHHHSQDRYGGVLMLEADQDSLNTTRDSWVVAGKPRQEPGASKHHPVRVTPSSDTGAERVNEHTYTGPPRRSHKESFVASIGLDVQSRGEEDARIAEEAERRREEEIRAMWAADRTAAGVYSSRSEVEKELQGSQRPDDRDFSRQSHRTKHPAQGIVHGTRNACQLPVHDDFDLTAALESQLDRDRDDNVTANEGSRRFHVHKSREEWPNSQYVGREQSPTRFAAHLDPSRVIDSHGPSRSLAHAGYEPHPLPEQYRVSSPAPRYNEPFYSPTQSPAVQGDRRQVSRHPQQSYRAHEDNPHSRPPQFAEAYEIVHIRDSQGEYVIRRPILRDAETNYATYEERPARREPPVYPQYDPHFHHPPDDQSSVSERQVPLARPQHSSRFAATRHDSAYYEEYDPRFPAAPARTAPHIGYKED